MQQRTKKEPVEPLGLVFFGNCLIDVYNVYVYELQLLKKIAVLIIMNWATSSFTEFLFINKGLG